MDRPYLATTDCELVHEPTTSSPASGTWNAPEPADWRTDRICNGKPEPADVSTSVRNLPQTRNSKHDDRRSGSFPEFNGTHSEVTLSIVRRPVTGDGPFNTLMTTADHSSPFVPTRWTLVLRAHGTSPEARAAVGELCEAHYQPVVRFLHREGREDAVAQDLAQGFFVKVLERGALGAADPARGRFRSYLLGAVRHFLTDTRKHDRRQKRGGGLEEESLDATTEDARPALQVADPTNHAPDTWFDRQWAMAVMERALVVVQDEFTRAGRTDQFEKLKRWLADDTIQLSQAGVAGQLGWSETAIKVGIHRLRKRFRESVREEIAQTVAEGTDIDGELRYLVEGLAGNHENTD